MAGLGSGELSSETGQGLDHVLSNNLDFKVQQDLNHLGSF